MEVPLMAFSPPLLSALKTATPGAITSIQGPKFEKPAQFPLLSWAATVIACSAAAGLAVQASRLELPAATTMVKPFLTAALTALSKDLDFPPPRLIFATAFSLLSFARLDTYSIAFMIPAVEPEPLSPRTLTATRVAFLATPYLAEDIVPAT